MLAQLPSPVIDPLWDLTSAYRQDRRSEKIDLVLGVYRDEFGKTPVMKAVQKAEAALASAAEPKGYRALSGNFDFTEGVSRFALGADSALLDRQCTIQTVAGTGALRLLGDFISKLNPTSTVWSTDPLYVNHQPIMNAAGLELKTFRWQQGDDGLDIKKVLQDLEQAQPGDILLLHGCCHNPTGIDPTLEHWRIFSKLCHEKGLIPFIDMAYQGFGDGVEPDAAGLRLLAAEHDFMFASLSCSKNMGLYCERVGAAMVLTRSSSEVEKVRASLEQIARSNYSMPPNHGAAVAAWLFANPEEWLEELEGYRLRISKIRQKLADKLYAIEAPKKFQCLAEQKGMFSLLPLSSLEMDRLRNEFAIYGTAGGRINIAGLSAEEISYLAQALRSVSSV